MGRKIPPLLKGIAYLEIALLDEGISHDARDVFGVLGTGQEELAKLVDALLGFLIFDDLCDALGEVADQLEQGFTGGVTQVADEDGTCDVHNETTDFLQLHVLASMFHQLTQLSERHGNILARVGLAQRNANALQISAEAFIPLLAGHGLKAEALLRELRSMGCVVAHNNKSYLSAVFCMGDITPIRFYYTTIYIKCQK